MVAISNKYYNNNYTGDERMWKLLNIFPIGG